MFIDFTITIKRFEALCIVRRITLLNSYQFESQRTSLQRLFDDFDEAVSDMHEMAVLAPAPRPPCKRRPNDLPSSGPVMMAASGCRASVLRIRGPWRCNRQL